MDAKQQAIENLLMWAKTCVEEQRASIGFDPDEYAIVPSWLPELENAIDQVENAE